MRYWLLCGKLKVIENRAYGYHIGGETMGIKTSRFEKILEDAIQAISDLNSRLDKAEKERDDALELLHSYRHICGETPPERLSELVQADREGRCVVLQYKKNDVAYSIKHNPFIRKEVIRQILVNTEDGIVWYHGINDFWEPDFFASTDIGKTVFRTRQEAESALKAMKEREDNV